MKKLSNQRFNEACAFVEQYARPLDRAFLAFWKGDSDKEEVVCELQAYQNEDGGFGHCLEPDFRLNDSSPMATTMAFQYITKLGLSKTHSLVTGGLPYFRDTFHSQKSRWHAVPKAVNDVPHAPWWNVTDNEQKYSANPDAEIVGYLHYYNGDESITSDMLAVVMNHLSDMNDYEIHEVLCYLRLGKLVGGDVEQKIVSQISKQLPYIVDRPEKWDHYGVQPIVLADSEQSPFFKELNQEINVNLDYIVDKQQRDGSWEPSWSWGQYNDEWEIAKQEWKGYLTVQQLMVLSEFGRIAD
ncbi:hypothetical protein ABFG93_00115 [Pseudalkalibacillus hwajinpoensis]|uniref:hypothetical protein n=1 Tax=Guptibacillus hwajinpoensis TaxID=208199 RepID=UPI00325BF74B